MDLQIDEFYKDAASGLLALYQACPRKIALYVEDLIGREQPDEFGLPSKRHQACLGRPNSSGSSRPIRSSMYSATLRGTAW